MNIGKNILHFRKEKELTQEQLANILDVSTAAISKWETNIAYPDITMLPKIATVFNISIDRLLNYNRYKVSIENIINEVKEHIKKNDYSSAISLLKLSLERYPNNDALTLELGKTLMLYANFHKDRKKLLQEAFNIFLKLLESNDHEIVTWANNYLCTISIALKTFEKAKYYLKKLKLPKGINPKINDISIKSLTNDPNLIKTIKIYIEEAFIDYSYYISWLINHFIQNKEYNMVIDEGEKYIQIIKSLNNELFNEHLSTVSESIALSYAYLNDNDKALTYLKQAETYANNKKLALAMLHALESKERNIYQKLNKNTFIKLLDNLKNKINS